METLAKQLEVSKAETLAAITERETLKIENEKLAAAITAKETEITDLRNTLGADVSKLQGEVKESQERVAQMEKTAATKASEIAAAAGHPPIHSMPAASTKATTTEELWAEFKSIKDMREQAKFYQDHQELWMK